MSTLIYKRVTVTLLLIIISISYSVSQRYDNLFVVGNNADPSELNDIINELSKADTTHYSIIRLSRYHHLLSSAHMWLDHKEKARHHWFRALEIDPDFMCHFTRMNLKRDIPEAHFLESVPAENYFAYHFDSSVQEEYFNHCNQCCNGGLKTEIEDTLIYNRTDSIFLRLEQNDQKYRGPNYISDRQELMDLKNRLMLDSIFQEIGFPNKFKVNENSLNTVWLIIHHSTDCNWNAKWIVRALFEIENGNLDWGFYQDTLDRLYHQETGYCRNNMDQLIQEHLVNQLMDRH